MNALRADLEREALAPFLQEAEKLWLAHVTGQGPDNRIPLKGRTYFQFGDLRISSPQGHLVIEVESAGGLTNLMKYWYCLEQGLVTEPLELIHLFRVASASDYGSHLTLWTFFAGMMENRFSGRFQARLFTYSASDDLAPVLDYFVSVARRMVSPEGR